jgi:alkylation response protein AidB-like acyl-CoA dehydrogenase
VTVPVSLGPEAAAEADLVARRIDQLLESSPPGDTDPTSFRSAQFDLGLAWVDAPPGAGGLAADVSLQAMVDQRLKEAGVDDGFYVNGVGLNLVVPALRAYGSPYQHERFLRPLFTCEEIWCQLFSEPGAGSDLAGLATTAMRRDDGGWTVNGQKVWTTLAHRADFGLLLARTNPDAPKHRGITAFIVDMHAPGVDVRGLREITGEIEFNEVFLTDVAVPDLHRVGAVDDGWAVALTMLAVERVAHFGDVLPRGSGPIGEAVRVFRDGADRSRVRRDELMRLWCEAEATRLTNLRASARGSGPPGPEGSVAKLAFATVNQRIYSYCVRALGAQGMLYPGGYPAVRRREMSTMTGSDVRKMFLRSVALSIEGGTSEIMRNVLAERVLQLPPEPRPDKGVPWRDVPRG